MMTLNDAILHCQVRAKVDCSECAREHLQLAEWLRELKKYRELEKQGKLLKLPCAVGDILYTIYSDEKASLIEESKIEEISTHRIWTDSTYFDYEDIGRTIFLIREDAEAALKKNLEMKY